jgi:perosamine synthetase
MALGVCSKDEVIVPDFTMIASANAVNLVGAKPVLVDIDLSNLCLDISSVEKAITKRTKAIMLVSLNGRSPDMNYFVDFAKDNNLFLIEDAAQSLGSKYKDKYLGTFGDIGSFSFSAPKVITTGQGGAIVTDNEQLYKKVIRIKDFGREQGGIDFHEEMGYNFKFTDLQAVIGLEQMKKLPWRVERKKQIFKKYKELLADVNSISFIETDLEDTSPWFIDILVNKGNVERNKLSSSLTKKGIGTRAFYPAIHSQPPYSWVKGKFPNSDYISLRGLWLPSSSFLTDDHIVYICDNIQRSLLG